MNEFPNYLVSKYATSYSPLRREHVMATLPNGELTPATCFTQPLSPGHQLHSAARKYRLHTGDAVTTDGQTIRYIWGHSPRGHILVSSQPPSSQVMRGVRPLDMKLISDRVGEFLPVQTGLITRNITWQEREPLLKDPNGIYIFTAVEDYPRELEKYLAEQAQQQKLTAQEANIQQVEEPEVEDVTPLPPRQTWLYRMFNDDGELLYIGITKNRYQRWRDHEKSKPWISEATTWKWEVIDPQADPLEVEKRAIKSERPRYNVVHNKPQDTQQAA